MAVVSALLVLGSATAIDSGNPLGWGIDEWVECSQPDPVEKTCHGISRYRRLEGMTYESIAQLPVQGAPGYVIEMRVNVVVRNGAVCGRFAGLRIEDARLLIAGSEVPRDKAAPILAQMAFFSKTGPRIPDEACTAFEPDGINFMQRVTIDGVRRPDLDVPMRWVHQDDGFRLR